MNWDSIKYIFQIPLSWYQKIHKRVFNAYGTNFLTVREGYYGGTEVGIDSDGFAAEVNRAVDLSGYVKSVDGQTPDENGNVELSGVVKTIDGEEPDENGNIELSDYYVTLDTDQTITGEKTFENVVNVSNGTAANDASIQVDNSGKLKIEQGTETIVETPKVTIANSTNTGHIDIDSSVPSLELYGHQNGLGGNIDFHTEGSTVDYTSRIIDSANQFAFLTFDRPIFLYSYYQNISNATGIMIDSANGNYRQLLTNEPARLYSTGENNQIATRGYCRLNFARASEVSGYVRSVNNILPDGNGNVSVDIPDVPENIVTFVNGQTGNVNLGNIVNSVNNIAPVNGNVTLDIVDMDDVEEYVAEQLTDYVQQTDLTDYVQQNELTNYALTSDLDDYALTSDLNDYALTSDLTDYVETVDGIYPSNGAIDFNLGASKWMKTDSNGHIATTNEIPIALSSGNNGYLYANNGSLQFKDEDYVTLSTNQVITSKKWFENRQYFQRENNSDGMTTIEGESINIIRDNNGSVPSITMLYSTGNGCNISRGSNGLQLQDTYMVGLNAPTGILLSSVANGVVLGTHPTDTSTTSKAVATVGYCQEKFLAAPPSGYTPTTSNITVVTGISWNGTQIVATRTQLRFYKGVFVGTTNQTNETINTVAYTP